MQQIQSMLQLLKAQLKQHQLTYADVAAHLKLSEASIKRIFSSGHVSLKRLLKMAEMVDLDFVDLATLIERKQKKVIELSEQQEHLIVSETRLLLVTVCVCSYWTFEDIIQTYRLEEAELINNLLRLEKMGILTLKPNNKIVLNISPQFNWRQNGAIEQYFSDHIQPNFLRHHFKDSGSTRQLANGMLSPESNQKLQHKITELITVFNERCQQDRHLPIDKKFGSSCLVALRPWELPEFSALRRNNKPFPNRH